MLQETHNVSVMSPAANNINNFFIVDSLKELYLKAQRVYFPPQFLICQGNSLKILCDKKKKKAKKYPGNSELNTGVWFISHKTDYLTSAPPGI